ncbi:MAG: hypothetical protein OES13_07440 [Acidimicrobiia bacterium]|nr:hypothetical protein [Acidimicrobiia bacterium]
MNRRITTRIALPAAPAVPAVKARSDGGVRINRIAKVLAFSLVVLALAAATATPAAAGRSVERPYKARTVGTSVVQPIEECDFTDPPFVKCALENWGTLHATHLGRSTFSNTGTATVNPSVACIDPNGLSGIQLTVSLNGVTVAADGSELYLHSEQSGCFVDLSVPLETVGTNTIVGGTGRFEGATGTHSTVVNGDGTGAIVATGVGTITY